MNSMKQTVQRILWPAVLLHEGSTTMSFQLYQLILNFYDMVRHRILNGFHR